MGDLHDTRIRVIKPKDMSWEEAMRYPEETDPPGQEFSAAMSVDEKFSFGPWKRDVQHRYFERPYHEVAYIIEGEVELTDDDGELYLAGPGDIVITPKGSKGHWKNLSQVKTVWGIYEEADVGLNPYIGPGAFSGSRSGSGRGARERPAQRTVAVKRAVPRPPSPSPTRTVTVKRPRRVKRCDNAKVLPARRRSARRAEPSPYLTKPLQQ